MTLPTDLNKFSRTGGRFDSDGDFIFFIAIVYNQLEIVSPVHKNLLISALELETKTNIDTLERCIDDHNISVFLDSGVFGLAAAHSRNHRLNLYDVIAMPPEQIDGFNTLWERYLRILDQLKPIEGV